MTVYKCTVIETQLVEKVYWVEAENVEEAREKMESGETIHEDTIGTDRVLDRNVVGEITVDD